MTGHDESFVKPVFKSCRKHANRAMCRTLWYQ